MWRSSSNWDSEYKIKNHVQSEVMMACGRVAYCHLGLCICVLLSSGLVYMRFTLIWACVYAFYCHMGL